MATTTASPAVFFRRILVAIVAACCIAVGFTAGPAVAATPSGGITALSGVGITSVSNGYSLDDQNGTTSAGSIIVTNPTPGYDESWTVGTLATDGSFPLVNDGTGLCIDAGLPLRQQSCDGRSTESWYFQPVSGSSTAFMIRQEGTDNCLDLLLGAWYPDAWTDSYGCNGSAAQQWTLPASADQAATSLALDHAASVCVSTASTCSWTTGSQSPAAPLPLQCVSPVWYNNTSAPVTYAFQLNNTTGWSDTIGGTLGTEFDDTNASQVGVSGGAAPAPSFQNTLTLEGKITTSVSGSFTNSVSQTLGNTVTMPIPVGQYGWVALSELATQVTGNWTFDVGGFPWTAPDTVTVPLTTDTAGGTSIYVAETNLSFGSCTG
ncbi:RICIN domain-containing protein [Streptacidiphilus albus]|uniref:RICIN domain-containing protein n=1 Tax=Streptacidiphilus albus TaxID=105425 RepID=UPI00054C484D|nr:hypothetical protein [Streptacidiphilus albus]